MTDKMIIKFGDSFKAKQAFLDVDFNTLNQVVRSRPDLTSYYKTRFCNKMRYICAGMDYDISGLASVSDVMIPRVRYDINPRDINILNQALETILENKKTV